jgi:hypothetical protein
MEMQKDYQRIESERWEMVAFGCPWKTAPKLHGCNFCLATTEPCKKEDCAVSYWIKAMTE